MIHFQGQCFNKNWRLCLAKKSSIAKNNRRLEKAKKYASLRTELRKKVSNLKLSDSERNSAGLLLQKLPRDSSYCRVVRRCNVTGRPRGNLRRFGLSRLIFRQLAHQARIPGVIKSSW